MKQLQKRHSAFQKNLNSNESAPRRMSIAGERAQELKTILREKSVAEIRANFTGNSISEPELVFQQKLRESIPFAKTTKEQLLRISSPGKHNLMKKWSNMMKFENQKISPVKAMVFLKQYEICEANLEASSWREWQDAIKAVQEIDARTDLVDDINKENMAIVPNIRSECVRGKVSNAVSTADESVIESSPPVSSPSSDDYFSPVNAGHLRSDSKHQVGVTWNCSIQLFDGASGSHSNDGQASPSSSSASKAMQDIDDQRFDGYQSPDEFTGYSTPHTSHRAAKRASHQSPSNLTPLQTQFSLLHGCPHENESPSSSLDGEGSGCNADGEGNNSFVLEAALPFEAPETSAQSPLAMPLGGSQDEGGPAEPQPIALQASRRNRSLRDFVCCFACFIPSKRLGDIGGYKSNGSGDIDPSRDAGAVSTAASATGFVWGEDVRGGVERGAGRCSDVLKGEDTLNVVLVAADRHL